MSRSDTHGPSRQVPHIVVGIDGSPHDEAALLWAANQAVRTQMALEIVTAFGPEHQYVDNREALGYMAELTRRAADQVQRIAPDLDVTRIERLGKPGQVLVQASNHADVLVVGSRGRGGFAGLMLGSVSRRCAHGSACPVLVVRTTEVQPDPEPLDDDDRRIVVGVDGSDSSSAALLWAGRQAEITGVKLEAISSWDWPQGYGWGPAIPQVLDWEADAGAAMDRALEPVRLAHPTITIDSVTVEGPAADVMVKASAGADLLAVGCQGHSELAGVLMGSVSDFCVTHAHCPVLVMHGSAAWAAGQSVPAR